MHVLVGRDDHWLPWAGALNPHTEESIFYKIQTGIILQVREQIKRAAFFLSLLYPCMWEISNEAKQMKDSDR